MTLWAKNGPSDRRKKIGGYSASYYLPKNITNHTFQVVVWELQTNIFLKKLFLQQIATKVQKTGKKGQRYFNDYYICNVQIPTILGVWAVSLAVFVKPIFGSWHMCSCTVRLCKPARSQDTDHSHWIFPIENIFLKCCILK